MKINENHGKSKKNEGKKKKNKGKTWEKWKIFEFLQVLSLSAGHAMMALLADAGRCLAISVRMAPELFQDILNEIK